MRPKLVVVTLLLGVVGLCLIGLLSGKFNRTEPEKPLPNPAIVESTNAQPAMVEPVATNPVTPTPQPAVTNVIATIPAEDYEAQKQRDLDAISDVLVSGNDDANALNVLASRFENVDPEVRKAAVEAALQLSNTNIIPQLNTALEHLKDPHDKAAILDAIAYLQLPSGNQITNAWEIELLKQKSMKAKQLPH
jgi:hypothetical protein